MSSSDVGFSIERCRFCGICLIIKSNERLIWLSFVEIQTIISQLFRVWVIESVLNKFNYSISFFSHIIFHLDSIRAQVLDFEFFY